jgi:tRNA dimethylallyltransferase
MSRTTARADAVLLMGPTGAGKTALALELARRCPVEIVSVDSALVYRGMDIGTSKPTASDRAAVPHHLIDICDPVDPYSAGRFQRDAVALIDAIRGRGNVPLLVGGTMLYFRALRRGLAPLPAADRGFRAALDSRARMVGWPALHAELAAADPTAAARIQPTDAQRIQRALEVLTLTGKPMSEMQQHSVGPQLSFDAYALDPSGREELYRRIDARLDAMMAAGFLDEVRRLRDRGDLDPELPGLRAVGYRQLWGHLVGETDLAAAVAAAKRATRNLAKRQLTWLRTEAEAAWIRSADEPGLAPVVASLRRAVPGGPARCL